MPRYAKGVRDARAVVLGCDLAGSAVAHSLCQAGWDVVLIDDIDPPGPWRGMSFVNAWYFGSAELSDVAACFCASVKSIPAVLNRKDLIAATSWSWQGVAASLLPDVLVDTRSALGGSPEDVRGRGLTGCSLGEAVDAGEPIADVNGAALIAPVGGVLRGLTARGARVSAGQIVVDIDPQGDAAACYGIDPWAAPVAKAVEDALGGAGFGRNAPGRSLRTAAVREPL